ncbi:hypothetical protein [Mesorhizobium sp. M0965]|uniref:hypothetical protein n=1 Tax=unclassified Mesorhizobium TaxID=325217 RepID=UPI00333DDAF2
MSHPLDKIVTTDLAMKAMGRVLQIVVEEIQATTPRRRPDPNATDRKMMAACKEVGAAVDRLLQAKFSPGEIPARKALERSALRLKKELERQNNARK